MPGSASSAAPHWHLRPVLTAERTTMPMPGSVAVAANRCSPTLPGSGFSFYRDGPTRLLLSASLTAAWDFRITASAWSCTKHLPNGLAAMSQLAVGPDLRGVYRSAVSG